MNNVDFRFVLGAFVTSSHTRGRSQSYNAGLSLRSCVFRVYVLAC